jgi:TonB family protein
MFWITLAAQLSAPLSKEMWFKGTDTPVAQLAKIGHARVLIRITVDPNGALLGCNVEESSGDALIDGLACKLTRQRARFVPARASDGSPSYGVRRLPVHWLISPEPLPLQGDMTVLVNRLPKGLKSPAVVLVAFAADSQGRISSCGADDKNRTPELVAMACEQLRKQYTSSIRMP